jgi:hypothetical protein
MNKQSLNETSVDRNDCPGHVSSIGSGTFNCLMCYNNISSNYFNSELIYHHSPKFAVLQIRFCWLTQNRCAGLVTLLQDMPERAYFELTSSYIVNSTVDPPPGWLFEPNVVTLVFTACQFGLTTNQNIFHPDLRFQSGRLWVAISCVMTSSFSTDVWPSGVIPTMTDLVHTSALNLSASFAMNNYLYDQRDYCSIFRLDSSNYFEPSRIFSWSGAFIGSGLARTADPAGAEPLPTTPSASLAASPSMPPASTPPESTLPDSGLPESLFLDLPSLSVIFNPGFVAGVALASIFVFFGIAALVVMIFRRLWVYDERNYLAIDI